MNKSYVNPMVIYIRNIHNYTCITCVVTKARGIYTHTYKHCAHYYLCIVYTYIKIRTTTTTTKRDRIKDPKKREKKT